MYDSHARNQRLAGGMRDVIIVGLITLILTAFVLVLLCVVPALLSAETATLSFDEPDTNANGTPLDDLKEHFVYRNNVKEATVPATRNTGGGKIIGFVLTVPDPVAGTKRTDSFFVTSVDTAGNQSAPSNTVTKTFDAEVPGVDRNLQVR